MPKIQKRVLVFLALLGAAIASQGVDLSPLWPDAAREEAREPVVARFDAEHDIAKSDLALLTPSDAKSFADALRAADRGDWTTARREARLVENLAARDFIEWRWVSARRSGASFDEINTFVKEHPAWPGLVTLQARAEAAMPAAYWTPSEVVDWFRRHPPVSVDGLLKLNEAYRRVGDFARADALVRQAWTEGDLDARSAASVLARYAGSLRPEDHVERFIRLMWIGRRSEAAAMNRLLPPDWRRLSLAREKFGKNAKDADKAFSRVPADLRLDPGLLFDRSVWLRKRKLNQEAQASLLVAAHNLDRAPLDVMRWWDTLHTQARKALDQGDVRAAYEFAANHKLLPSDQSYSEAEFFAGWVALRFMSDAGTAAHHFDNIRRYAGKPITYARAFYWLGRAAEASSERDLADEYYRRAARFRTTFYGQLAASLVKAGPGIEPAAERALTKAQFLKRETTQVMRALADIDANDDLRNFAAGVSDKFSEADEFAFMASLLQAAGETTPALRIAKKGLQKNLPVVRAAFPTLELPEHKGGRREPERALVLALTRQESEFNARAMSHVGARGLMQLMPATAKMVAKSAGVAYNSVTDLFLPERNMQLGMAHVSDLLNDFKGSYILTIVSYNAGPGRARQWIAAYGDPRAPGVDVVDWIERIPFDETRNYVQRVLENTQVYRTLLASNGNPPAMREDLGRGSFTVASTRKTPANTVADRRIASLALPLKPVGELAEAILAIPVAPEVVPAKAKPKPATTKRATKKQKKGGGSRMVTRKGKGN